MCDLSGLNDRYERIAAAGNAVVVGVSTINVDNLKALCVWRAVLL